jgi:hypothetical protein
MVTPLLPLKLMVQSQLGGMKTMEAKGRLEVMAMSRFIPLMVPLLPLKLMVRSLI